jgi:tRNA-specific 2-thiouridylase
MTISKKRAAVAMSGGIDSSVAALLMKEMGYEVIGVTERIVSGIDPGREDLCFSEKSVDDAGEIARRGDFEHHVIDARVDFERLIIDPFCQAYLEARTPNPCIYCNRLIKFDRLAHFAHEMKCDLLVTGHYARKRGDSRRWFVSAGKDTQKDQSYFLYQLPQEILARCHFPLGEFTKDEIRQMARDRDLHVAGRPESREICFVDAGSYATFIEDRTGILPPPGEIVDTGGRVLGRHQGIHRYTIGQRRGLGIAAPHPLYVLELDPEQNRVIVGPWHEQLREGLVASEIHWMKHLTFQGEEVLIKTRSTQPALPAVVYQDGESLMIRFNEAMTGVTPGQAVVIYDREMDILAGGTIVRSVPRMG